MNDPKRFPALTFGETFAVENPSYWRVRLNPNPSPGVKENNAPPSVEARNPLNPFLACLFAFKYAFILVMIYLTLTALGNLIPPYRPPAVSPRKRFLILIPAHNEAAVLGDLLRNLFRLRYPRHLYRVV